MRLCDMLGRLRSTQYRTREGRRRFWRAAILIVAAFTISAALPTGDSRACPLGETSVERLATSAESLSELAPSTAPASAVVQPSFVQAASSAAPSRTIPGFGNCCGDPSHHADGTSCVTGACSACCAVAQVFHTPIILSDFSRRHGRPMELEFPTDMATFLFRPPRSLT
jgi:hypothetical protein